MAKRNNYKSKWLAALEEGADSPQISAQKATHQLANVTSSQNDAVASLRKVQHRVFEVAAAAKELCETLNDTHESAGFDFGEVTHAVDMKLSSMPLDIILRRVRDIIKVSDYRIGILSIHSTETHKALQSLTASIHSTTPNVAHLQKAMLDTTYIGASPTPSEMDDYQSTDIEGYHRYGIQYEDMPDDWMDLQIGRHAMMTRPAFNGEGSDDDSDESESDNRAALVTRNRNTRIVPASSPVANGITF